MASGRASVKVALTFAAIIPVLADCDVTSAMIGDPVKLSQFALGAVKVDAASGRGPTTVAADVKYCEDIARAASPIAVNGGAILGQSMTTGAVIGAANGATSSAGSGHTGLATGMGSIGGALQGGTAGIAVAQNIAVRQAYNQTLTKTECLLQKNYGNSVVAPPDVLAAATAMMTPANAAPASGRHVVDGLYDVHPLGQPNMLVGNMEIESQGPYIIVRGIGQNWTGQGQMNGGTGFYDWRFANGASGRTDLTVNPDGSLQGHVVGSGLNWRYEARHR